MASFDKLSIKPRWIGKEEGLKFVQLKVRNKAPQVVIRFTNVILEGRFKCGNLFERIRIVED